MTFESIDSFAVTGQLRFKLGLAGYAVFMRLCEICKNAPDCRVALDVESLAWDMRADESIVRSVINDFQLFNVSDGWFESIFFKSQSTVEKEKKEEISRKRSAAGKKSSEARAKKKYSNPPLPERSLLDIQDSDDEENEDYTFDLVHKPVPLNPRTKEPECVEPFDPEMVELRDAFDKIKDAWNETYKGTRSVVTWFAEPPAVWQDFLEAYKCHPVEDFIDAFKEARKDKKFAWTFGVAVREKNVAMLLSRADLRKDNEKPQTEDELPLEQREILEYAKATGKYW